MNTLPVSFCLSAFVLVAPAVSQTTVDGSTVGDNYGAPVSLQAVETQFGDNLSELDGAYASIEAGRLFLCLTGNLEDNFNKLEIFIDSVPGGENVFSGVPGNDGAGVMAGLTFDAGFEADYHVIVRRGFFGQPLFDLDVARLGSADFSSHTDVFGGANEGSGVTGTGPGNASPIDVAYDNSNVAGILGGTGTADQAAAEAVTTGFEMSIALTDLGTPGGDIRVCAFVNGSNHDFASNQFLGPLTPPQANLGGDGLGNFTGVLNFDLGSFVGDQFFTITHFGDGPYCTSTVNSTGNASEIDFTPELLDLGGSGDFVVTATNLPSQPGIFIGGPTPSQIPFFDGFLCVDPVGLQRFTEVNQPDPANLAVTQQTSIAAAAPGGLNVMAGQSFNVQRWNRDPAAAGTGATFSDAYAIAIGFLFPCKNSVRRQNMVYNVNVCAGSAAAAMSAAHALLCPCFGDCPTGQTCTFTGLAGAMTTPVNTGVQGMCPMGQTRWTVVVSTPNGPALCQCQCQ